MVNQTGSAVCYSKNKNSQIGVSEDIGRQLNKTQALLLQVWARAGHVTENATHLHELCAPIVFLNNAKTIALGVGLHATPKPCSRRK